MKARTTKTGADRVWFALGYALGLFALLLVVVVLLRAAWFLGGLVWAWIA